MFKTRERKKGWEGNMWDNEYERDQVEGSAGHEIGLGWQISICDEETEHKPRGRQKLPQVLSIFSW